MSRLSEESYKENLLMNPSKAGHGLAEHIECLLVLDLDLVLNTILWVFDFRGYSRIKRIDFVNELVLAAFPGGGGILTTKITKYRE